MDRKVVDVRFNDDQTCFTCAMETGFRIYHVDPLVELKNFDPEITGSVRLCGVVERSDILWVVFGGSRPLYCENTVGIFDISKVEYNTEMKFTSRVTAVCMKIDKIVVSTATSIEIIGFQSYKILKKIDVADNSRGLLQITPSPTCDREIIVYPGCNAGSVQIMDITNIESAQTSAPATLGCHNNELACIQLNQDGSKLATASVKGTIIRIWDTVTKTQLLELRRGCEPARIYCISFDKTSEYLCCSSDKGTGHIFAIDNTRLNKQMMFGKFLGKYGGGLKSFATFQFPPECPCIVAFGDNMSIHVVGLDGTYNRYMFSLQGHCDRDIHDVYTDLVGEDEVYQI